MTARATATTMATDGEPMIDQYIAAWNETDPVTRRELIARTWAEQATMG